MRGSNRVAENAFGIFAKKSSHGEKETRLSLRVRTSGLGNLIPFPSQGGIEQFTSKITIGSVGTFQFNGEISTFDDNDRIIMGLTDKMVATYEDVLECIDHKDKTRFEETTLGIKTQAPIIKFAPIQLNNGNIIQDTHFREFNEDGTLKYLEGYTKLVGVV